MIVELKGRPKSAQGTRAGFYILGPNEVNGKSHWLQDSGTNAIWYDKANGNWNIGDQDNIGSTVSSIYTSEDVAGPQEAKTWQYISDGKWIISDDILVFTFKPGMYINTMRIIWVFLKTDMYFHLPEFVFYYRSTEIDCRIKREAKGFSRY